MSLFLKIQTGEKLMRYFVLMVFSAVGLLINGYMEANTKGGSPVVAVYDLNSSNQVELFHDKAYQVELINYIDGGGAYLPSIPVVLINLENRGKKYQFLFSNGDDIGGNRKGNVYKNISLYDAFEVDSGIYECRFEVGRSSEYKSIKVSLVEAQSLLIHKVGYAILTFSLLIAIYFLLFSKISDE